MKLIGNLIWFVFYGFWVAAIHFVLGVALCITIVFIPAGLQNLKIAKFAIWPFGRSMGFAFEKHPFLNMLWIFFGGAELAAFHLIVGVVLCLTLIGIPFANKCFKLARLCFIPYGAIVA